MSMRTRASRSALSAVAASILGLAAVAALAVGPVAAAVPYGAGGIRAAAAPASVQVATATTTLGTVLVGPSGMTLYTLSSDPSGGSVCTGQCLTFWPPLLVAAGGAVTTAPGVSGTFATFVRTDDGTTQVTDDSRAIYYFKNDTAPGQTNGEGIKGAGGVWHVALATGAAAPSPTAAPAASEPAASEPAAVPAATEAPADATPPPTSTDALPSGTGSTVPLGLLALVVAAAIGSLTMRRRLVSARTR
jgi:predicted lipoprotein with Yx(FWY)xxD motif